MEKLYAILCIMELYLCWELYHLQYGIIPLFAGILYHLHGMESDDFETFDTNINMENDIFDTL